MPPATHLTAGLAPPRVDAPVKRGLLDLVAHAHREAGWSLRRSASVLGIEHTRLARWAVRAVEDRLVDVKPGPDVPVHALLDWEREAILTLAEDWAGIDRSHRKLAHRGSRLEIVHVSESTVWRVLVAAGVILPAASAREPRVKTPWPDWAELVPGVIYIYDFTHFRASRRCAVAVLDVVSRLWLSTVVSPARPPRGLGRDRRLYRRHLPSRGRRRSPRGRTGSLPAQPTAGLPAQPRLPARTCAACDDLHAAVSHLVAFQISELIGGIDRRGNGAGQRLPTEEL